VNRWTTQLTPPELLGSHIASGRSHTTGRVHDLSFRAATAIFGHFGIEWDLSAATAQELAQLKEWVSFYKANRRLLMGGDLVRLDFPDPNVLAHGIVAPDHSSAIYTVASMRQSEVMLPCRLRFPGLDPNRRYRIRPVLIGSPPSGLNLPPCWGAITTEVRAVRRTPSTRLGPPDGGDRVALSGTALASTGVMSAGPAPRACNPLSGRSALIHSQHRLHSDWRPADSPPSSLANRRQSFHSARPASSCSWRTGRLS
jgi:alpha-galactosidase